MKRVLAVIGLVSLVVMLAASVQAQVPTYGVVTAWTTNGATAIPVEAATAMNAVIDCRKQASVTLQITAQGDTSVGACTLYLVPSIDGVTYAASTGASTCAKTIGFTPLTASALTLVTNINTYGAGYWKVTSITNTTGAAVTNFSLKYAVKISSP